MRTYGDGSRTIRTLLQVQIASVQYLTNRPLSNLPDPIAQAGVAFEKDVAQVMHAMASVASGKPVAGVPDIGISAAQFQEAVTSTTRPPGLRSPLKRPMCWALLRVWHRLWRHSMKTSATPSPPTITESATTRSWRTDKRDVTLRIELPRCRMTSSPLALPPG